MHISLDSIDPGSFALRGCTPSPSFKVRFTSVAMNGTARLVPASGIADARPGSQFEVEIAHESVTAFRLCENVHRQSVLPLTESGNFDVHGVVVGVSYPFEPAGNRITYVDAAGAQFILRLQDIGACRPDVGACVAFTVHDVSLWDEVI